MQTNDKNKKIRARVRPHSRFDGMTPDGLKRHTYEAGEIVEVIADDLRLCSNCLISLDEEKALVDAAAKAKTEKRSQTADQMEGFRNSSIAAMRATEAARKAFAAEQAALAVTEMSK